MENPQKHPETLIDVNEVQAIFGVSKMTIWRWCSHDQLGFPRPVRIQRRRYWKEAEVVAWLREREAA